MDLTFTPEQSMLRDNLGRFLAKAYDFGTRQRLVRSDAAFSAEIWSQLAGMGLLGLPFSEVVGGYGGSIVDVVAISEVMGEHLMVEPYLSTVMLGGLAIAGAREQAQVRPVLDSVMAGDTHLAFAHEEGRGTADPTRVELAATPAGGGVRLNGEKRYVLNAGSAAHFVVSARTSGETGSRDGLTLVLVDASAPGVLLRSYKTVDGRTAANVSFADVDVAPQLLLSEPGAGLAALEAVIHKATLALCAEAVGAMGALLRITADYAATRRQFGQPIGSFQAIAHRIADMHLAYQRVRATLMYTAALVESGACKGRHVSILKALAGRLGRRIGESAIQVHGGVGMTDELNVGHYFKRILAADAMFGDSAYHERVVGRG